MATVVKATADALHAWTVFDKLKVILCISFILFRNIHAGTFLIWYLHFPTFQETVESYLKPCHLVIM